MVGWTRLAPGRTCWQPPRRPLAVPELRVVSCNVACVSSPQWIEERFNDYHQLILVTAWCLRFTHRFILRSRNHQPPEDMPKYMTSSEIVAAEHSLLRLSQFRSFQKEKQQLLAGKGIAPSSRLRALSPFLDKEQLLRVGGRLSNSALSLSQKHPIITDSHDHLMVIMFNYMHVRLGHCGPTLLFCSIGDRFHVVGARRLSRTVCSQCVVCRRAAPKPLPQLMVDLPADRVNHTPAFTVSGLDFAGPVTLKKGHTRRPVYIKAYICAFVCFATRSTHLEVVSDLTTEAFVASLRRFASRRSTPWTIYSDNESNFKGARNKLQDLYTFLEAQEHSTLNYCRTDRITWKMIPERAPHFGGLWESAVRSMKHHLRRIVGAHALTFEEMITVTCQIEACLNSRPIIALTKHNTDGIFTLTSGHFLVGKAITAYPEEHIPTDMSLLKRWNLGQAMVQHFWTRWSREYLQTLQAKSKWRSSHPNLQVDDIVSLKEDRTFACHWPLAKILQVFPGKDGVVRVAQVKTLTGIVKRPVVKLALLHRDDNQDPDSQGEYVQTEALDNALLMACLQTRPSCKMFSSELGSSQSIRPHYMSSLNYLTPSPILLYSSEHYLMNPITLYGHTHVLPAMSPTNPCSLFLLLPFLF